jgi:uncharacterized protein (DUF736 family)
MSYDNTNTGALFRNKKKESEKHPDYTGSANVEGKEYWVSSWLNESKAGEKYLSLKLKAKDEVAPRATQPAAPVDLDDDLPF